jgi:uncharacterized membrane protein
MTFDTLSLILYILIAGFLFVLPYLVFPTLPFGVRIPLAYIHDPAVTTEHKRYQFRLGSLAVVLLLAGFVVGGLFRLPALYQLSLVVLVIGDWVIYYLGHRRLGQVKINQKWFADKRQVVAASAAPRSKQPSRLFWVCLAFPCAVLVLTAAIAACRYPALPASLHFVFPRNLGEWTLAKTPLSAFLPVLFQGIGTLLFGGLAWLYGLGARSIDVEDPVGSLRYQQINQQIVQALLLFLALGLNLALLVAGLAGWGLLQASGALIAVISLAPMAVWLIVAPILLLAYRPSPRLPAQPGSGVVNRDDDRFWKLGMVYFNREDPSLLVNKRFGIGRTFNFGNPVAWVIILGLVVFILVRVSRRF